MGFSSHYRRETSDAASRRWRFSSQGEEGAAIDPWRLAGEMDRFQLG